MFSLASTKYKDQFARLNIVRGECAKKDKDRCSGNCKWQTDLSGGRCVLSTLEALLSFSGDDCPFAILFRRQFSCASLSDKEMCDDERTPNGLPRCEWTKNT